MPEIANEIWRPALGYEAYCEVSSHGRVRDMRTKELRPQRLLKGYPGVTINGIKKTVTVHSLVAAAFIGPRPEGKQVNHKDGVKTYNYWKNLEYMSSKENIKHSWEVLGNSRYGTDNPAAKLTTEIVQQIRAEYVPKRMGFHRLAKKFGVTKRMIANIIQRKNWVTV